MLEENIQKETRRIQYQSITGGRKNDREQQISSIITTEDSYLAPWRNGWPHPEQNSYLHWVQVKCMQPPLASE